MVLEEAFIHILEILGFKSHIQFSRFLVFVFHEFIQFQQMKKKTRLKAFAILLSYFESNACNIDIGMLNYLYVQKVLFMYM